MDSDTLTTLFVLCLSSMLCLVAIMICILSYLYFSNKPNRPCSKCKVRKAALLGDNGVPFCQSCNDEIQREKAEEYKKKETEAKKKEMEELEVLVQKIIHTSIPQSEVKHYGLIYWDTAGSSAQGFLGKLFFGGLLSYIFGGPAGGVYLATAGDKYHNYGIIVVSELKVFLFTMGHILGDSIRLRDLQYDDKPKSVLYAMIKTVQARYEPNTQTLILEGGFNMKVKFPECIENNIEKSIQIAKVLQFTPPAN